MVTLNPTARNFQQLDPAVKVQIRKILETDYLNSRLSNFFHQIIDRLFDWLGFSSHRGQVRRLLAKHIHPAHLQRVTTLFFKTLNRSFVLSLPSSIPPQQQAHPLPSSTLPQQQAYPLPSSTLPQQQAHPFPSSTTAHPVALSAKPTSGAFITPLSAQAPQLHSQVAASAPASPASSHLEHSDPPASGSAQAVLSLMEPSELPLQNDLQPTPTALPTSSVSQPQLAATNATVLVQAASTSPPRPSRPPISCFEDVLTENFTELMIRRFSFPELLKLTRVNRQTRLKFSQYLNEWIVASSGKVEGHTRNPSPLDSDFIELLNGTDQGNPLAYKRLLKCYHILLSAAQIKDVSLKELLKDCPALKGFLKPIPIKLGFSITSDQASLLPTLYSLLPLLKSSAHPVKLDVNLHGVRTDDSNDQAAQFDKLSDQEEAIVDSLRDQASEVSITIFLIRHETLGQAPGIYRRRWDDMLTYYAPRDKKLETFSIYLDNGRTNGLGMDACLDRVNAHIRAKHMHLYESGMIPHSALDALIKRPDTLQNVESIAIYTFNEANLASKIYQVFKARLRLTQVIVKKETDSSVQEYTMQHPDILAIIRKKRAEQQATA